MPTAFPKRVRNCLFIFVGIAIITVVTGCVTIQRKMAEGRIQHYFGLTSRQLVNSTNIQSALLAQFPVGTPSATVEATLQKRGMGVDGKSTIWRPETNEWSTNNTLCCAPYDYEEFWFSTSPMRHIGVCFDLDAQSNVRQIEVDSYNYGL